MTSYRIQRLDSSTYFFVTSDHGWNLGKSYYYEPYYYESYESYESYDNSSYCRR